MENRNRPSHPGRRLSGRLRAAGLRAWVSLVLLLGVGVHSGAGAVPAPAASAASGLSVDEYRQVLARMKNRMAPRETRAVGFRFNHQFEDAPEIVFTAIIRESGEWLLVRKIWSHEERFRKGEQIDGAVIVEIARDHALCEYKRRTSQFTPRTPPPAIQCTKITRKGDDWIAELSISGTREEYRKGDEVQGVQIAEITVDSVECSYFGIKGLFKPQRPFPTINGRLSRQTPEGWQLFVQEADAIKVLRPGDVYRGAKVKEIRADGVTFEFEGQEHRVTLPELPALVYSGPSKMGGKVIAFLEFRGKQCSASSGEKLDLGGKIITIDEIAADRVKYRFNEVPLEVMRR